MHPDIVVPQRAVRFTHVTVRDGLSNNSVFSILQDHLGFLWFGTFSGLNRYDGREIRTYRPEPADRTSISGSVVFDMLDDSRNRLWIGTGGGLNRYDYGSDSFETYLHDPTDVTSIPSDSIFSLEEASDGSIWIGTADAGIAVFDPESERFRRLTAESVDGLESDVIRVLHRDRSGRIWVGTTGGLSVYTGEVTMEHYLEGHTVRDIFEDSRGTVWIGTEEAGLLRVVPGVGGRRFDTVFGGVTIRTINEDRTGRMWVGTERDGVVTIESDGTTRVITYETDESHSLSNDFVRDIYIDRSGLVWIATRGGGLNRYNPRSEGFEYILDGDYAPRQIMEDEDGTLWIATDGQGIYRIGRDGRTQLTHRPNEAVSLLSDHIYSLAIDRRGDVWIGSDGDGLERLNRATGESVRYRFDPEDDSTIPSNVIWSLLVDAEGRLWVGSEGGGLGRYDHGADRFIRFRNNPTDESSLIGNSVRALYEDSRGILWIGTWDGGLSRLEPSGDRFVTFTRNPGDATSISDNSVNSIAETPDGTLWVGTSGGGLNAFDTETQTFRSYRVEDGLPDNNVVGLVVDPAGDLWVATANGLAHLNTVTEQFTNYWQSDGLPADEFGRNSALRTRSGAVVLGTDGGVVRFSPDMITPNPFMPPVRITGFSLFNEPVTQDARSGPRRRLERNIVVSDSVNILPGDSFVGFTFAALDFTDPSKNTYAIQLIGFDPEPRYVGATNRYFYSSLPPGEYTLRVMGANSNRVWSREHADLRVEVHPSFFQQWYFFVIVAVVVGVAIAFIARIRIRGLHRRNVLLRQFSDSVQDAREEERRSVARDVHDELGQLLSTLKMHIFWLSKNAAAQEEQRQARYDSMLGIIGATLDWTKEMATRLRPVALDNLTLAEAVEWLVRETDKHSEVGFTWEIASTGEVSVDRATTVFRVVQEILTNIVRHSRATRAHVVLQTIDGRVCIDVRDNGIGIDRQRLADPKSYGIIGMRERVRRLGGEIRFRSDSGGVQVLAKVPTGEATHS
ncbi:MAG: histidine kinase [Spirochaetales bacterium]|nr:histidine kinase [Spirochaetales bacterium]